LLRLNPVTLRTLLLDKAVLAKSTHPCVRLDKLCAAWTFLFALCGGIRAYHKCDYDSDQRTHEKRQEEDPGPTAAFAPCDIGGHTG
jgi:hypothetical protein